MSDQDLRTLIQQLRRELDALPSDDVDARQRLDRIVTELDRKLAEPDREDDQDLVSNLQNSIYELETRHPDTTALLNNIMMTLANMGI